MNRSGTIDCWGANSFGQLGLGDADRREAASLPVVSVNEAASKVAAGGRHVCAIVSNDLYCWGANEWAQSGQDPQATAIAQRPGTPILAGVSNVSAGLEHTCAQTTLGIE